MVGYKDGQLELLESGLGKTSPTNVLVNFFVALLKVREPRSVALVQSE